MKRRYTSSPLVTSTKLIAQTLLLATALATVNEEYDYSVLDPYSAFGTPYGGWSRATRSRLENLPLILPYKEESALDADGDSSRSVPFHMQVRDAKGQLFACRVYQEDELDPSSLADGMFEPPKFRKVSEENKSDKRVPAMEDEDDTQPDQQEEISLEHLGRRISDDVKIEISKVAITADGEQADDNIEYQQIVKVEGADMDSIRSVAIMEVIAINTRLGQLNGVCGHLHLGWWSYEWCFEKHIMQFHISLENEALKASDFTNLGEYKSRKIEIEMSGMAKNQLAQGEAELGRVVDTFSDGDMCPETGKPRSSTVTMVCCGDEVMSKHKNANKLTITRNGEKSNAQDDVLMAALHAVHEREVCEYDIVVCTPLLCADQASDPAAGVSLKILSGTKVSPFSKTRPPKEDESVREILDRTLGGLCLQTSAAGWWTYEFCHGNSVRQFHDEVGIKKTAKGTTFTSRVVESEHILGKYSEEQDEDYPDEKEHEHVFNATVTGEGIEKVGNGAYFEVKYVDGNVCDESEVTDRAIVSGGSASASRISRASSVRYFCGSSFSLSVSEDSTCHYIVEVTVPDLCNHVLFKAPAMVQQVIKCLAVNEVADVGFGSAYD